MEPTCVGSTAAALPPILALSLQSADNHSVLDVPHDTVSIPCTISSVGEGTLLSQGSAIVWLKLLHGDSGRRRRRDLHKPVVSCQLPVESLLKCRLLVTIQVLDDVITINYA